MDSTTMANSGHNRPIATYRDGRLKATLWGNQSKDGDTYYTVNLAKIYEDRNGKMQETSSFSDTEILRVNELAKEARSHALHLRREQSMERKQTQSHDAGGHPARFQDRSGRQDPGPGMER